MVLMLLGLELLVIQTGANQHAAQHISAIVTNAGDAVALFISANANTSQVYYSDALFEIELELLQFA